MALIQLDFQSECLHRHVQVNAYIPLDTMLMPGMEAPKGPFKTLYLLHGYTGGCYDWLASDKIGQLSQMHNIAIIMPDGENHFYVDAVRRGDRYSEFIGRELVAFTRSLFPLSDRREDTMIGGISMGGYGSLYNGMKYADTFGHIIGISPANIIHELADSTEEPNNVGATRGFYESVFGDLSKANESELSLPFLARSMKAERKEFPDIYFACGYNDMLIFANREFHRVLNELGVEHVFEEGPGTHEPLFFEPHLKAGLDRVVPPMPPFPNPFWIETPAD